MRRIRSGESDSEQGGGDGDGRAGLEAERAARRSGAGARRPARSPWIGWSRSAQRAKLLREAERAAVAARDARRSLDRAPDRRRRALAARGADGRRRPGTACSTSSASWCRAAPTPGRSRSRCPRRTRRRRVSRAAARVALRDEAGGVVGIVDELEVFDWDKPRYATRVYRTERLDHPGGRLISGDSAAAARRRAPARAAAAGESRVRRVHALAAARARADPRAQVAARAGLPDAQSAAPRPRVRARRRRRAADARGLVHGRRAQPAGRRAEGRRRAGAHAHALLPRAARSRPARRGRQGRGALARARLRPHGGLRADRSRHPDVLRRAVGSGDARHLPPELRLQRPRDRAQARGRALRGRQADLGRLRRAGDLRRARRASCTCARARSASRPSTSRSGAWA